MTVKMFYGRVSSAGQNAARQTEEAERLGIDERYVFIDTATGKNFDREKYRAMVAMLRPGDEVYMLSLDRLGRNYAEIADAWRMITQEIGAHMIVLDMPILDTRQHNDLTGTLICDIVLKLLSYVAEKELEAIHTRQAEGIAIAKAAGKYKGRQPMKIDKRLFEILCADVDAGERTVKSLTKRMGICRETYYKLRHEMENKEGRWDDDD